MELSRRRFLKPIATLAVLVLFIIVLPNSPIDPWHLLNPKKVVTMIFALALIQIMGSILAEIVGTKAGAILTGFIGGLVSSTATTASLARQSSQTASADVSPTAKCAIEVITFLSATTAMLFEGVSLLAVGTSEIHPQLLIIFAGPILATFVMIFHQARKVRSAPPPSGFGRFHLLSLLKLSAFVVSVLMLSKVLQKVFGTSGLYLLTFLVSLFEIHGSIIANIQLHDAGAFGVQALGGLLTLSIVASYVSKLFLISTLGGRELKSRVLKGTIILFLSLTVSWTVFYFVG